MVNTIHGRWKGRAAAIVFAFLIGLEAYGLQPGPMEVTFYSASGWHTVQTATPGSSPWKERKIFPPADFNGDGRMDFSYVDANNVVVMLSKGDGGFTSVINDTSDWADWRDARNLQVGDFNGDGRADWSWFDMTARRLYVMLSAGDGHFQRSEPDISALLAPYTGSDWMEAVTRDSLLWAIDGGGIGWSNVVSVSAAMNIARDFNGDGRADWAHGSIENIGTVFSDANGGLAPVAVAYPDKAAMTELYGNKVYQLANIGVGDFNGDGRSDWVWVRWVGDWRIAVVVLFSTGDGHFVPLATEISSWIPDPSAAFFSVSDIDGDGMSDLSFYRANSNAFITLLSTVKRAWIPIGDSGWVSVSDELTSGRSIFSPPVFNDTSRWGNWAAADFFAAADLDGDGKADWSWYAPWSNDFIRMLSTGDGTYRAESLGDLLGVQGRVVSQRNWNKYDKRRYFAAADFNGDGRSDYLFLYDVPLCCPVCEYWVNCSQCLFDRCIGDKTCHAWASGSHVICEGESSFDAQNCSSCRCNPADTGCWYLR